MDAFFGEIRLMAIGFTPRDWLPCDGRQLAISQFQALFSVIGIYYGGDTAKGVFNLPDLRGRVAVGAGNNPQDQFDPVLARQYGAETVTLTSATIPPHTHELQGAALGVKKLVATPAGNWLSALGLVPPTGATENADAYVSVEGASVNLNAGTLSTYPGQGQAHENRQPYQALGYFICINGEYPARQ